MLLIVIVYVCIDFCKSLSKSEALGELSSISSEGEESETEKGFHHPFLLKERPSSIIMNIRVSIKSTILYKQLRDLQFTNSIDMKTKKTSFSCRMQNNYRRKRFKKKLLKHQISYDCSFLFPVDNITEGVVRILRYCLYFYLFTIWYILVMKCLVSRKRMGACYSKKTGAKKNICTSFYK